MPTDNHALREPLPRLLSITEVADSLGVEVRHVRRLVHERRVPFIKWGHLLRFDPDEIQAWIDTHRRRSGLTPGVPFSPRRRSAPTAPPWDR